MRRLTLLDACDAGLLRARGYGGGICGRVLRRPGVQNVSGGHLDGHSGGGHNEGLKIVCWGAGDDLRRSYGVELLVADGLGHVGESLQRVDGCGVVGRERGCWRAPGVALQKCSAVQSDTATLARRPSSTRLGLAGVGR